MKSYLRANLNFEPLYRNRRRDNTPNIVEGRRDRGPRTRLRWPSTYNLHDKRICLRVSTRRILTKFLLFIVYCI